MHATDRGREARSPPSPCAGVRILGKEDTEHGGARERAPSTCPTHKLVLCTRVWHLAAWTACVATQKGPPLSAHERVPTRRRRGC